MATPAEILSQRTALIERWHQSGKSIKQFCNDENFGYHAFHYWKKKLKGESVHENKSALGFIRLEHSLPEVTHSICCELVLSRGNRILFHTLPPVNFVKQLLK